MSRGPTRFDALVGVGLGLVLLVGVNYLGFRHYERFDITSAKSFTLSDRTRQVLRGLDRDVTFHLLVPSDDQMFSDLDELLRSYAAESRRVRVSRVDPIRQEGEYRLLATRLGVLDESGSSAGVDVVVEAGSRRWNVRRDDLLELDADEEGAEGPMLDVGTERALTGAVLEVISGRKTKVCVTTGHGEYALTGTAERTLAELERELARDNVVFETVAFGPTTSVPASCDALFVLGPQRPFDSAEAAVLGRFVDEGGKLLVTLDPKPTEDGAVEITGLEAMLAAHGIVLGRDLVLELDAAHLLTGDPTDLFKVDGWSEHPLVAPLRAMQAPVAFHSARSVGVDEKASVVAATTPSAFAARALGSLSRGGTPTPADGDLRGPVGLVAVFPGVDGDPLPSDQRPRGRLVVVGDTDFLRSELLSQPVLANVVLSSALVGHLTERPALISIPPRRVRAQALLMPADGPSSIRLRVVVLLPLAFALLGLSVHWSRRS